MEGMHWEYSYAVESKAARCWDWGQSVPFFAGKVTNLLTMFSCIANTQKLAGEIWTFIQPRRTCKHLERAFSCNCNQEVRRMCAFLRWWHGLYWRQRNDRMWNSSRLSCSRSSSQLGVRLLCAMEGSSSLLCQYASRHDRGDLLTTAVSKWEASLKCNMDAAVLFSQNLAMGTRFFIRDHRGQVLWCGCWQNRGIYNPLMAEALANLASTRDNRDGY